MKKLHNGSVYAYKGQTVRLHLQCGAVSALRNEDGQIFSGRSDLLKRIGEKRVERFIAKMR